MSNVLEKGKDTIQKICDTLRKGALEPALSEANQIIENARHEAEDIVLNARKQANDIISQAQAEIERQQRIYNSSLNIAAKQALETLKQEIENNLFQNSLDVFIKKSYSHTDLMAELLKALIQAIKNEGIKTDLGAVVGKTIPVAEMNRMLGDIYLQKLMEGSVTIGQFDGGIQLRLHDKSMTLDISDKALKELLERCFRKDFRKYLFGN